MIRMLRRRDFLGVLPVLAITGCRRAAAPIAVGSHNSTEQAILGEIAAQHLEHRLQRKILRRLRLGGSQIAFQSLQDGEVSFYAAYTGAIVTDILREQPSSDPSIVLERARSEMRRTAQSELLDPLGFRPGIVGVIRADDLRAQKIATLSEAAAVKDGWRIAITFEYQQRSDVIPPLNQYHLPMTAPIHAVDSEALFKTIQEAQASMIFTSATDGMLESGKWKILQDDRNLFTPQQVCFLVRQSAVEAEPRLRGALGELSGKFTNETMRKLNAQVDIDGIRVEDVARVFLKTTGLA
jgi:glycine betaine/choline ABC-type transport system substrate-binding protein